MLKRCASCKEEKPIDAFVLQRSSKDGHYPYCRSCVKKRQDARYARRPRSRMDSHKICTWCRNDLPRSDFRRTDEGKYHARCASCEDHIAAQEAKNLRRCNICYEWLPHASFHPSKLRFPNVACRSCVQAQTKKPEYRLRARSYQLQKEYGLTVTQYDELVAKQGGNCPICLKPLPPDRGGYVDHVHSGKYKGKIRAILHGVCNRFIMWEHEDSGPLRRAADLIDNPLTDWVVPGKPSSEIRKQTRKHKKEQKK